MKIINHKSYLINTRLFLYIARIMFCVATYFAFTSHANASALSHPPNNLGLVGYWNFNEGTGTKATDFSGNGNTGTLTNMSQSASVTPGKSGQAFNFDGVDDYIISSSFGSPPSNITLSAWVKPNASGGVVLTELGQGTINSGWHDVQIEVETNNIIKVCMWTGGETCVNAATGIVYGQWYHVIMRYDSSNTTLTGFVNGVQGSSTVATKQNPGTLYYAVGATDSTNAGNGVYFSGLIDEVRIYNRALSASEVLQLYNLNK